MFRSYTLRTLDEDTIMKWLAVTMCLILVVSGMIMPVVTGKLAYYLYEKSTSPEEKALHATLGKVAEGLIATYLTLAIPFAASGPIGLILWAIGFGCSVGAYY